MGNGLPSRPTLVCTYRAGPREVRRTSTPSASIRGKVRRNRAPATHRSRARLRAWPDATLRGGSGRADGREATETFMTHRCVTKGGGRKVYASRVGGLLGSW